MKGALQTHIFFYLGPGPGQSGGALRQVQGELSSAEGQLRPRGDGWRSGTLRLRQTEEPALGWRRWGAYRLKPAGGWRGGQPWGVGVCWPGFLRWTIGKNVQVVRRVGWVTMETIQPSERSIQPLRWIHYKLLSMFSETCMAPKKKEE